MKSNAKPVRAYNRDGDEYVFDSITSAAQALGVSYTTVRQRIEDGYTIHVKSVKPVHVAWA